MIQKLYDTLFDFKLSKDLREKLEDMSVSDGISTAALLRGLIQNEWNKRQSK